MATNTSASLLQRSYGEDNNNQRKAPGCASTKPGVIAADNWIASGESS